MKMLNSATVPIIEPTTSGVRKSTATKEKGVFRAILRVSIHTATLCRNPVLLKA